MVILPIGFTATRYPGYYWHMGEQALYSLKSGSLRKMKMVIPNRWNHLPEGGYDISVSGRRRTITLSALKVLACKDSIVEYKV